MPADVIPLWYGPYQDRIRIPGPGEDKFEARIFILPARSGSSVPSAEPEIEIPCDTE